jgi:hypothetical protein
MVVEMPRVQDDAVGPIMVIAVGRAPLRLLADGLQIQTPVGLEPTPHFSEHGAWMFMPIFGLSALRLKHLYFPISCFFGKQRLISFASSRASVSA